LLGPQEKFYNSCQWSLITLLFISDLTSTPLEVLNLLSTNDDVIGPVAAKKTIVLPKLILDVSLLAEPAAECSSALQYPKRLHLEFELPANKLTTPEVDIPFFRCTSSPNLAKFWPLLPHLEDLDLTISTVMRCCQDDGAIIESMADVFGDTRSQSCNG
jgi:hypothetical protein